MEERWIGKSEICGQTSDTPVLWDGWGYEDRRPGDLLMMPISLSLMISLSRVTT